jgi:hypothetical protein
MKQMRNAYNTFVGEPEGKRPLGRPRRRWKDNIRMGLTVGGCELDSSDSGLGPVAGPYKHGNELSDSIKGRIFLTR